ncbi:hypothetical protein ACO0K9_11530 [Undibacterium sp. Ji50W]|uniref:hypothetical protein n=1 Tax=Undibacterium sp. Ji50W TaxID=3413041 RepID=UPI003BF33241
MAEEKTLGEILTEIKAEKGEAPRTEPLELWSPDVAIMLSFLLTPIFGTFIHMENWSALRESGRARKARIFLIICATAVVSSVIFTELYHNNAYYAISSLGMLLVWYVADARAQVKYFKERVGNNFRRKSWLRAIAVAMSAYIAMGVVVLVLNESVFHIG